VGQESVLLVQLQRRNGVWVDVGRLHNRDERNWFEVLESYWDLPDRPVLGQIFEEHGRAWSPNANVALPHWFSHLLPEGRLRRAVAEASRIDSRREFQLLTRLGATDLPGAIRALPTPWVTGNRAFPHTPPDIESMEDPVLKFSLAGAQLKFSVYGSGRGLTVPARGQAGNYVLKFPDGRPGFSGVPEAELGSLELARRSGMTTPDGHLVSPSDVAGLEEWSAHIDGMALATRRFDRADAHTRIHMEEIAQVLDIPTARESAKYRRANFETIAVVIAALCGTAAVGEVIDRIVLNVLIGNGDAHLKNWAILYPDGRHPRLSPVYDVVPTVLFIPDDDMGLKLGKSKSFEDVTAESFDALGRRSGFGVTEARRRAREAVERVLANWSTLKPYLTKDHYERLTGRLQSLGLAATEI
jgi:serine/threonine-protein kinase HipA